MYICKDEQLKQSMEDSRTEIPVHIIPVQCNIAKVMK